LARMTFGDCPRLAKRGQRRPDAAKTGRMFVSPRLSHGANRTRKTGHSACHGVSLSIPVW
jgi:hypothetical protein